MRTSALTEVRQLQRGQSIVVDGQTHRVHRVDVSFDQNSRVPPSAWVETTTGCPLRFRPNDLVEAYLP